MDYAEMRRPALAMLSLAAPLCMTLRKVTNAREIEATNRSRETSADNLYLPGGPGFPWGAQAHTFYFPLD